MKTTANKTTKTATKTATARKTARKTAAKKSTVNLIVDEKKKYFTVMDEEKKIILRGYPTKSTAIIFISKNYAEKFQSIEGIIPKRDFEKHPDQFTYEGKIKLAKDDKRTVKDATLEFIQTALA